MKIRQISTVQLVWFVQWTVAGWMVCVAQDTIKIMSRSRVGDWPGFGCAHKLHESNQLKRWHSKHFHPPGRYQSPASRATVACPSGMGVIAIVRFCTVRFFTSLDLTLSLFLSYSYSCAVLGLVWWTDTMNKKHFKFPRTKHVIRNNI